MTRRPRTAHHQDRSRQTAARLLEAAETVLEKHGIEGASVPEIARRAGVSPASIYRRFVDKDGLLREVFERFFERSIKANEEALQPSRWKATSLEKALCALVAGMVAAYSQRPGLLRAVISYSEQHPDAAFRRRALELRERSMAGIEKIVLLHAKEIRHPQPRKAVRIALQLVSLALKERISPSNKLSGPALPAEQLRIELTRLFLGYLRYPGRVGSL
ncbi:MAG TPA: TetR/AcrR family transcriptional regulator [Chthoniobacterales bacterium]|nr:TetR/AcrR family transcriptional regulator [Chthoniobacterales bacterium]